MDEDIVLLKSHLSEYAEMVLDKSVKGKDKYKCPFCSSGSNEGIIASSDGAFSIYQNQSYKCFSCGAKGDIFTLYAYLNNLDCTRDFPRIKKELTDLFGLTPPTNNERKRNLDNSPRQDFREFYIRAHQNIEQTTYLAQRGIEDKNIIEKFNLGYVEGWKHPKAPSSVPGSNRLIIPISPYTYTARNTKADEELTSDEKLYKKQKAGSGSWLFNIAALQNAEKPVWILEGELDAISIYEVGGEAIALGSISNIKTFVNEISNFKLQVPLIIALDNDGPGRKAQEELADLLKNMEIHIIQPYKPFGEYKDANEMLQKSRSKLHLVVSRFNNLYLDQKGKSKNPLINKNRNFTEETSNSNFKIALPGSLSQIKRLTNAFRSGNSKSLQIKTTGFSGLDYSHGVLYQGLYILGGGTGIGKSTLALQFANEQAGRDNYVIYFSMEQSVEDLLYKSVSWLSAKKYSIDQAVTADDIKFQININADKKEIILDTMSEYENVYSRNIEFRHNPEETIESIIKQIEDFIDEKQVKPIVIIDYLQFLRTMNRHNEEKYRIDDCMKQIKSIRDRYDLFILVLCSLNRSNYNTFMDFDAFMGSSLIEHTADVVWGLQLSIVSNDDFVQNKMYNVASYRRKKLLIEQQKCPRSVELVCLKNRGAATGYVIPFRYFTKNNIFLEERNKMEEDIKSIGINKKILGKQL